MLSIKIFNKEQLTESLIDQMWAIYEQYYYVSKELFINRLKNLEKNALFFDQDKLVGFTGLEIQRKAKVGEKNYTLIGLEQTVIDTNYRHRNFIQRTCLKLVKQEKFRNPLTPIYIWTAAASYRPYLIFSKHLKEAYPTFHSPLVPQVQEIIDYVGQHSANFPNCRYIASEGVEIVEIDGYMKEEQVPAQTQGNPHLQYYKNLVESKQHYFGEKPSFVSVIVVAPVNLNNLYFWAKKLFQTSLSKFFKRNFLSIHLPKIEKTIETWQLKPQFTGNQG